MSWHVAPSLVQLRNEINKKWPNRDKRSDGSIGDAAHSARYSDHNPNSRRSVNALDIDKDGIDVYGLRDILIKDSRVNYVIFNGLIFSRVRNFRPKRYTGVNAHKAHLHVSILQSSSAENNTKGWGISKAGSSTKPKPRPKPKPGVDAPKFPWGSKHYIGQVSKSNYCHSGFNAVDRPHVKKAQQRLRDRGWSIKVDGRFNAPDERVVRQFQKEKKLAVDGKIGPKTWAQIWEAPVT